MTGYFWFAILEASLIKNPVKYINTVAVLGSGIANEFAFISFHPFSNKDLISDSKSPLLYDSTVMNSSMIFFAWFDYLFTIGAGSRLRSNWH